MAIMRTNRLTSKTTTPPSKGRRMVPAAELEAQDAAYKKYKEQDLPAYNEKMKKYETEKNRVWGWGGENISRSLNPAELSEYNARQRQKGELEYKKVKVDPSYNKKPTDADWMTGTWHRTYDPIKPTAPNKSEPADWSNVELNKMPTKKATISAPKGKLKEIKVQEFGQFEAPSMDTKVKTKRALTGGGDKGLVRAGKTGGSLKPAQRVTGEKTIGSRSYKKEKQQFEAFAKPLPSGGSLNVMQDTSPVIKRAQAEAKQLKGAYRKEGNREGVKMMRQEANQLGKAAKFADKMYEKGGGDYFTRDMVKGFRGSDANPANQNTIERQQKLINSRK